MPGGSPWVCALGAAWAFWSLHAVAALGAGLAFHTAFVEEHAAFVGDIQVAPDHPGVAGIAPGAGRQQFVVAVIRAKEVDPLAGRACGTWRCADRDTIIHKK